MSDRLSDRKIAVLGPFAGGFYPAFDVAGHAARLGATVVAVGDAPDVLFVDNDADHSAAIARVRAANPACEIVPRASASRYLLTREELLAQVAESRTKAEGALLQNILDHAAEPLDLSGADLRQASLRGRVWWNVVFDRCDFTGANLRETALRSRGTPIVGATFDGATMLSAGILVAEGCTFRRVDFRNGRLDHGRHVRSDFTGANMRNVIATNGEFVGCIFRDADLSTTDLRSAVLRECDLTGATLVETFLEGATATGCTFAGADLRRTNALRVTLDGADLRGANLSAASLGGASLKNADLRGAALHCTDLTDADLTGANLDGADLAGAVLHRATLPGTDTTLTFGPAILALTKALGDRAFETRVTADLGDGGVVELRVEAMVYAGTRSTSGSATIRRNGEYAGYRRVNAPTAGDGLCDLAALYPAATMTPESVTASISNRAAGKAKRAQFAAAWAEAFGRR